MSTVFGYIRVSSRDQNEERQLIAMKELDISQKNIYIDKQSGKDFNRPQYKKMVKRIKPGDILYIKSIDRLGRNYDEILEQWRILTKEKMADIVVIDMPLLDTREKDDNLTGRFISDLVLQILSYVAQTEREFIKKRQAEGISAAKQRGVKFGAKRKEIPAGFDQLKAQWVNGEVSIRKAADIIGIPPSTFYKWCKEEGI